ncbi:MAG: phosphatase PAP2 family protein [Rhodanobacter sp.]
MAGGVALSKLLYMLSGWHPAGWNFIGLSGHAAFSFLFFPAAAALVTSRGKTALRVVVIALGACLAFAISLSSWVSRDHSLTEVVLGALWGALIATVLMTIIWRHVAKAPVLRKWMIVSLLLLAIVAYKHEFPSTRVLSWVALQTSGHPTIHTRTDLGPQARLPMRDANGRRTYSQSGHARAPIQKDP